MKKSLYTLWCTCILVLFMNSMFPWYMWNNSVLQLSMCLTVLVSALLFITGRKIFAITKSSLQLILIVLLAYVVYLMIHGGLLGVGLTFIVWVFVILLKERYKRQLLSFITKWFSILILVSLTTYIFYLLGFSIPPSTIVWNDGQYIHYNYYTFLISTNATDFFRFMSIFMEPGHMTMGLVPLIMANRFDLKNRYVLILFIAGLFSFSLAAYITIFLGYVLFNLSRNRIKHLAGSFLVVASVVLIVNAFPLGHEVLDYFLWDRLEFEDGTIVGNNRTTQAFDRVYENVMNSPQRWFGDQDVDIEAYGGISGFKKFLVTDGLCSIIVWVLLYLYNAFRRRNKDVLILSSIILLLLFQNAYPMWHCVFFCYCLGAAELSKRDYNGTNLICTSEK